MSTQSVRSGSAAALGISTAAARELTHDLHAPKPWIYWTDLLASTAIGYGAFVLFPVRHPFSALAVACVAVASLALYRAVLFVHELVHSAEQVRYFGVVWHLLCGVPLLAPKFMYEFHREHHAARSYGTTMDGEYFEFADLPRWRILLTPLSALLGPLAFAVRFLVLTPLSWIAPAVRRVVLTRASALVIDVEFRRVLPDGPNPARWLIQEVACFCYAATVVTLFVLGRIPLVRVGEAYVVFTLLLLVNWVRVLAAHRYESGRERLSFTDQVLDSVDHTSTPVLAELWAPLGLRYHAVHHFLPAIPYHNIPEARRRLATAIDADGGYWQTADRSLANTLRRLLSARTNQRVA